MLAQAHIPRQLSFCGDALTSRVSMESEHRNVRAWELDEDGIPLAEADPLPIYDDVDLGRSSLTHLVRPLFMQLVMFCSKI